ncbi:MAG: UbiA family prenyltransferase [Candidatus Thorarchaeota archaeon]
MIQKTLLFRNLVDNLVKNLGLYSVGVLLLVLYRISYETAPMMIGLVAFIIAYSSVYIFNDLFDAAEDATDTEKITRKPLASGSVERTEAVVICLLYLFTGLLVSTILGFLFLGVVSGLILVNLLYSAPLPSRKDSENLRLKHTVVGLPLVLIMQSLKIFLPWTITSDLFSFPYLFAIGFSCLYLVLFKGYKRNLTVGQSFKHETTLTLATIIVLFLSMLVHQEPIMQAMILAYLLAGIAIFWKFRLIDKRVILVSPIYILLGVIALLYLMTYV